MNDHDDSNPDHGNKRKTQSSISNAVIRAQVQVTYTPAKRLRKQSVSAIDAAKFEAALSNDAMFVWDLTSNMAIEPKMDGYRIRLLKQKRSHATKGERIYSPIYDCIYSAENAAFSYRYSMESKKSRLNVDDWLENTQKFLTGEAIMPQEQPSADDCKPEKRIECTTPISCESTRNDGCWII
jgi:hypothetical protein